MKFNKNHDEVKNFTILKKSIFQKKNPYSKIILDYLFSELDPDVFRNKVKEDVAKFIEKKIAKK